VRLAIREALAFCALDCSDGAARIVETKLDAVILAMIAFRGITVQMLLVAMLIDAFHSAFED